MTRPRRTSKGRKPSRSPEQATDTVQRSSHMNIEMSVHPARNRARPIYHCHCHPYLSPIAFGMAQPPKRGRRIVLLPQGDPSHPDDSATT